MTTARHLPGLFYGIVPHNHTQPTAPTNNEKA
ncbi:hypothetical protein [uncultured Mediterranean phage uvMED]|nr:hypothetical protein [uncultured Mediterranean phage uvMED]BAQ93308.1 hypothetical protein [uncultured Mediterranean phage uvMED]BAR24579.1 hypothetical protein [uncultured Mediterranean phage uvMED]